MHFGCRCGYVFHDNTDNLRFKASLLPAQSLGKFAEIAKRGAEPHPDKTELYFPLTDLFFRTMYQCPECGRLYIEEDDRFSFCVFSPSTQAEPGESVNRRLLSAMGGQRGSVTAYYYDPSPKWRKQPGILFRNQKDEHDPVHYDSFAQMETEFRALSEQLFAEQRIDYAALYYNSDCRFFRHAGLQKQQDGLRFPCRCGKDFYVTKDSPYQAFYLADQDENEYADICERAEKPHAEKLPLLPEMIRLIRRNLYQCPHCGRLYFDDMTGKPALTVFTPDADAVPDPNADRHLLMSVHGEKWRGYLYADWDDRHTEGRDQPGYVSGCINPEPVGGWFDSYEETERQFYALLEELRRKDLINYATFCVNGERKFDWQREAL